MVKQYVSPLFRRAGFKGTCPTWRQWSPQGDCVLVNLQRPRETTAREVWFYVNLSVVPLPYWEFWRGKLSPGKPLAMPSAADGMLRRRVDPPNDLHSRLRWSVSNEHSAEYCAHVLTGRLNVAVPELQGLLDRERLITFLRSGHRDWRVTPNPTLALGFLAADEGLKEDLNAALASLAQTPSSSPFYETSKELTAWLQHRAAAKRQGS
jgi:hypothetical protein